MTVEAVNAVLQSAPVVRANAEQTSTADASGNPNRVQRVAQAPYVSPYVTVDVRTNTPVLQLRDSDTGKVLQQIPSQTNLQAQSSQQELAAPQPQQPQPQQQQAIAAPAPAPQQQNTAAHAQQVAAFTAAAQSGNTNAGTVNVFA